MTDWLFFASDERLGAIRPDGTGERYPDFGLPDERQWRMGYVSPDGGEAELYSLESGKTWSYDFGVLWHIPAQHAYSESDRHAQDGADQIV